MDDADSEEVKNEDGVIWGTVFSNYLEAKGREKRRAFKLSVIYLYFFKGSTVCSVTQQTDRQTDRQTGI